MFGIIGGMGSFAGLRMLQYAMKLAIQNGADCDDEFPKVIYYNLPAKGIDTKGVSDGKMLYSQIMSAVSQLETAGCSTIIIGCCSAHVFHSKVQGNSSARIINMVELACHEAAPYETVGILCSETSKQCGLFDNYLTAFGAKYLHVSSKEQTSVNSIIHRCLLYQQGPTDTAALQCLCDSLQSRGAKSILLGCTELGISYDINHVITLPIIEAGFVAVEEAMRG